MPIDLNTPIAHDPADAPIQNMLKKLQGNILRGHGRNHTRNLLLSFTATEGEVRAKLQQLLPEIVTSAFKQQEIDDLKLADRGPFGNFFLTRRGYEHLGFTEAQVRALLPESPAGPVQSNFFDGMKLHSGELGDPPSNRWEPAYQEEIHALILLADQDEGRLDALTEAVKSGLASVATVHATEHGKAWRRPDDFGFEHFGFVDGISQPVFFKKQLENEGSIDHFSPLEPLGLVLVPDGGVPATEEDAFGSFYVFRKLEQRVRDFHARERQIADELDLPPADRERVGAMAVGRFRDGTPLVKYSAPTGAANPENDFIFEKSDSSACPWHAHIRKVNPRGEHDLRSGRGPGQGLERTRRIVRRAIPYGDRAKPPFAEQTEAELPNEGVGLLFACFQASIARQFAFMQRGWANDGDFAVGGTGVDPVIGTPPPTDELAWNRQWGDTGHKRLSFGQFVTMKGGEFFFAPSMPFIARLAPP